MTRSTTRPARRTRPQSAGGPVIPDIDRDKLVVALRDAAQSLTETRSVRDIETTLTDLVHAAVDTVPHAQGGGISRAEHDAVRSAHATGGDVYELDRIQSELVEGPCITAADDPPPAGIVLAQDLAGDEDSRRWPRFAPAAVAAGYRSLMSVTLSFNRTRRSALNLYAPGPDAFDESDRLTAGLFGLQAAVLLHGAEHAANLGQALATRDTIGQAKGILMERFTVDDDEAFQMLVRSSQGTNLKLLDVARWLTEEAVERRVRNGPRRPVAE